ncbi:ribonuclease III [Sulfurivermis fontis]|uniref:ribonuclease III n=1 Tax=Sulfurivermis fontis TaxID=1972068 RepID=UPI000FD8B4D0|nr:ribonuclease III [Sulfurivermis fontis]
MNLDRLCRSLGYTFRDTSLLETALTHRSVGSRNNERLEFLGDAVLSFAISAELYRRFPAVNEGTLSRLRASLVKGDTLARIALDLEIGEYLHLGSGEMKSGGFRRESILADALEAIFGAVYLDSDIERARQVILALYDDRIEAVQPAANLKDPKTRLQEYLQARRLPLPTYNVIAMDGEAHEQTFTVTCAVEGLAEPTVASAASRRKAEQAAADLALRALEHD